MASALALKRGHVFKALCHIPAMLKVASCKLPRPVLDFQDENARHTL